MIELFLLCKMFYKRSRPSSNNARRRTWRRRVKWSPRSPSLTLSQRSRLWQSMMRRCVQLMWVRSILTSTKVANSYLTRRNSARLTAIPTGLRQGTFRVTRRCTSKVTSRTTRRTWVVRALLLRLVSIDVGRCTKDRVSPTQPILALTSQGSAKTRSWWRTTITQMRYQLGNVASLSHQPTITTKAMSNLAMKA